MSNINYQIIKTVYLASPYSHPDPEILKSREEVINNIAARLYIKYKVAIYPPIMVSAIMKRILGSAIGTEFTEWASVDLSVIRKFDEVWVAKMPGYKESIGVTEEIKFAKAHQKKVRYFDITTLEFDTEAK